MSTPFACAESCAVCGADPNHVVPDAVSPYAICARCGVVRRARPPRNGPSPVRRDPNTTFGRASMALRLGALEAGARVLVVGGDVALAAPCSAEPDDDPRRTRRGRRRPDAPSSNENAEPNAGRDADREAVLGLCQLLAEMASVTATAFPPPSSEPLASYDVVLIYDALELVNDPLELLHGVLRWAKPGATILVETHNLARASGPLDHDLLDGRRAHVFDEVALRIALGRAGIRVERMDAGVKLLARGEHRPGPVAALPVAPRGPRVAACIDGHRHLERLRFEMLRSRDPAAYISNLAAILARPTFDAHVTFVVRDLDHLLERAGAYRLALAVCEAALAGDVPSSLRQHCLHASFAYRARLGLTRPQIVSPAA
ncbi:MAG: methyltransferase domain-containing protein [Sandaracinaceae bacterium]